MPDTPTIFVSHSHLDTMWCCPFVAALQGSGLDVWCDEKGLQASAAWVKVTQRELQAHDIFLFVLTPTTWASARAQEEIQLALATRRRIIVVEHLPTQVDGFLITHQWIRVVGLDAQSAAQLIAAEIAPGRVIDHRDPPPPEEREPIGIPENLYRLGYRGWRMQRTGVSYIEPPTCPITAGVFAMGSAESDKEAKDHEKPQCRIPVAAFAIGKHPVTVAEYSYFLSANPGKQDLIPHSYTFPKDYAWCAPEWRGKALNWQAQQI